MLLCWTSSRTGKQIHSLSQMWHNVPMLSSSRKHGLNMLLFITRDSKTCHFETKVLFVYQKNLPSWQLSVLVTPGKGVIVSDTCSCHSKSLSLELLWAWKQSISCFGKSQWFRNAVPLAVCPHEGHICCLGDAEGYLMTCVNPLSMWLPLSWAEPDICINAFFVTETT